MTDDELIEALENADEPNEALNDAIQALTPKPHLVIAPNYTGEVDAALTLVPPKWHWLVHLCCTYQGGPLYTAVLIPNRIEMTVEEILDPAVPNRVEAEHHPTPALALCIAALRARKGAPAPDRQARSVGRISGEG